MNYKQKNLNELKVWLTPGIGVCNFYKIKRFFDKDISDVFNSDITTLKTLNLNTPVIEILLNKKIYLDELLEKEINYMQKYDIKLLAITDKKYPENLKNIPQPPPFLFVRGDIAKLSIDTVAIVGTRYPSLYGSKIAHAIAKDLAANGITIVSGLARGIDAAAHKGALETGNTIGVIGNGFKYIYPAENRKLYEKIIDKNVIISESSFETKPEKFNFPVRNRLISGLSKGVLIVEAAEKSGSLITAMHATEQGRDVFAIPGEITNPRAIGPNMLIKDGAKIVLGVDDILEEIFDYQRTVELKNEKNKKILEDLDEIDKKIYELITTSRKIHFDEITQNFDISVNVIMSKLLNLELKNLIKELPGKFYCNDI